MSSKSSVNEVVLKGRNITSKLITEPMELTEETGESELSKWKQGGSEEKQFGVVDCQELRLSSQLRFARSTVSQGDQLTVQETSSSDSLEWEGDKNPDMNGTAGIEDLILQSDIDVNRKMAGEEAYADFEKGKIDHTKLDEDSGIHSNVSEVPNLAHSPQTSVVTYKKGREKANQELQENIVEDGSGELKGGQSPVLLKDGREEKHKDGGDKGQGLHDTEVGEKKNWMGTRTNIQTFFHKLSGLGQGGSAGAASRNEILSQRRPSSQLGDNHFLAANLPRFANIDESLRRFEESQESSTSQGISCGSNEDLLKFVKIIPTAPIDSGIFLEKYKDVVGIRTAGNFLTRQRDYTQIHQFQPGKEIFLCRSNITGQLFVTKQVPLVYENFKSARQRYGLYRQQQVDLVVANQDSCPWDGLAIIYGLVKRKLKGKECGEIFMEYCEDETLWHKIRYLEKLDITSHLQLAQRLLDIVKYLHDQDIIHGDLKLENVGMRKNGLALIDFEGAKHPGYKMNNTGTCQYAPPWFEQCFHAQNFELLKTWDMWSLGIILLKVIYGKFLFAREYAGLRNCDTCDMNFGVCLNFKENFLELIKENFNAVQAYLPRIHQDDGPLEKRLILLIHGLLSAIGPQAQLTAGEAVEALDERNVVIQVLKDGRQTIAPVVVQKGIKMKNFINLPYIQKLKLLHEDLCDGMWFSHEWESPVGYRHTNVDLNQKLTECCVLHVHPPQPCSKPGAE